MRMRRHWLIALLASLLLAACGGNEGARPVSLPPEFVGEWTAPGIALLLTERAEIRYSRLRSNGSTLSISGPLLSFGERGFSAGFGPLSTKFRINSPPRQDGIVWRMTVDDIEMVRPAAEPAPPEI